MVDKYIIESLRIQLRQYGQYSLIKGLQAIIPCLYRDRLKYYLYQAIKEEEFESSENNTK